MYTTTFVTYNSKNIAPQQQVWSDELTLLQLKLQKMSLFFSRNFEAKCFSNLVYNVQLSGLINPFDTPLDLAEGSVILTLKTLTTR